MRQKITSIGWIQLIARVFISVLALMGSVSPAATPVRAGVPSRAPVDLVLVLDNSGSMGAGKGECDMQGLRYSAARLAIAMLEQGDRVAVVEFSSEATVKVPLTLLGMLPERRELFDSLTAPVPDGKTNIAAALDTAANLFDSDPQRARYIIFLTDGKPDPDEGAQRAKVMTTMLSLQGRAVVYPVALTTSSASGRCTGKSPTLEEMGAIKTAQSASELTLRFSEIVREVKPNAFVVTRQDLGGRLELKIEPWQSAQQVMLVAEKSPANALSASGASAAEAVFGDANVDALVTDSSATEVKVLGTSSDPNAFFVVQASTYVDMVFPPSADLNEYGQTRRIPMGSKPIVLGRAIGAPDQRLYVNGSPMPPLFKGLSWNEAVGGPVNLKVGDTDVPLYIERRYDLKEVEGLPRLTLTGEAKCSVDEACALAAQFETTETLRIQRQGSYAFVLDHTEGKPTPTELKLVCDDIKASCSIDEAAFVPKPGRKYEVVFLLAAQGVMGIFGDALRVPFETPAYVELKGLPKEILLPAGGEKTFVGTLRSGVSQQGGELRIRSMTLRAPEGGADLIEAGDVAIVLDEGQLVSLEPGAERPRTLRATVGGGLPAKRYEGQVEFEVVGVEGVQAPPPVRLVLDVRPVTVQAGSNLNLGSVVAPLGQGRPFSATVPLQVRFDSPEAVRLRAEPVPIDGALPFQLSLSNEWKKSEREGYWESSLNIQGQPLSKPGTYSGKFTLQGADEMRSVQPSAEINWVLQVEPMEFQVLGLMQDGGERSMRFDLPAMGYKGEGVDEMTVRVRYNGDASDLRQLRIGSLKAATWWGIPYFSTAVKSEQFDLRHFENSVRLAANPGEYDVVTRLALVEDLPAPYLSPFGYGYVGDVNFDLRGMR
ncbi:MAG: VWA domain-containing protein, partial [Chloroflexi bacterium]|nr:VWA domain-containing protein [Chloroflexota bacterium]